MESTTSITIHNVTIEDIRAIINLLGIKEDDDCRITLHTNEGSLIIPQ